MYMLDTRPQLSEVTYLDADLFSSPIRVPYSTKWAMPRSSLLRIACVSVLHHQVAGIYNVQFLTFRNDPRGGDV